MLEMMCDTSPSPVEITRKGILIAGIETPILAGTIHYWRHDPLAWGSLLDGAMDMGLTMVDTYVPWSVHETRPGHFDFGESDPSLDLKRFLLMCMLRGLLVSLRPGPHINAEMTGFGFPDWILADEEIMARTPSGDPLIYAHFAGPFPVPSLYSERLFETYGRFMDHLASILVGMQAPAGPVAFIQLDNESCYYFREHAYTLDYSPSTKKMFHDFLCERYVDVKAMNRASGGDHDSFHEKEPPTGFPGVSPHELQQAYDWIEFKEELVAISLRRLASMWRSRGVQVPFSHNSAWQHYSPVDFHRIRARSDVDLHGIDAYPNRKKLVGLKRKIRYLCGTTNLPFCPEFGCGIWSDQTWVLEPDELRFTILYAFMCGLRAINLYMIAERDRWVGSPMRRDGSRRTGYFECVRSAMEFISSSLLLEIERIPRVLVLRQSDLPRLRLAVSRRDPDGVSSELFLRKPKIPRALFLAPEAVTLPTVIDPGCFDFENDPWCDGVCERLMQCSIDYDISDSGASLDELRHYEIVFASAYGFLDIQAQQTLVDFARSGGRVVLGPSLPCLDRRFEPCRVLQEESSCFDGLIRVLEDPSSLDVEMIGFRHDYSMLTENVEIGIHAGGGRVMLFLACTAEEETSFVIQRSDLRGATLRGLLGAPDIRIAEDQVFLHGIIPALTVWAWEVLRDDSF